MSITNLDRLFRPRSIAVVGASEKPQTVGSILVQNLVGGGFAGEIYPINPKYEQIQGLTAYRDVTQLPTASDLAIVAVPAQACASVLRQLAAQGNRAAVVISAGFREVGESGRALEQDLAAVARDCPGFRILGPNCLGFLVPGFRLNASFAAAMPAPGSVAFVSQSGALCTAALDWAIAENVGFSYFISLGNQLDVDFADLIDYLANDEQTHSLVLYIESLANARKFMSAARAFTQRKPIVVYKAGRFGASAAAAASHTGAMAGLDAAYEAAFQRAAIVRVFDSDQLVDCAELLARSPLPRGNRLAIVTNAGGPGVMATDALIAEGGALAALSAETINKLKTILPAAASAHNPVDVLGDATADRFARASRLVLQDDNVDALLAILTPQAMTRPLECAEQLSAALGAQPKPTLAAFMGEHSMQAARRRLNRAHVPTYTTPERAVRSFLHLASYAHRLETLYEAPRSIPLAFQSPQTTRRAQCDSILAAGAFLSEPAAKQVLQLYDIPTVPTRLARSAAEVTAVADEIGYPLVMKIVSRDIVHKSDVGGVRVKIEGPDELRRAYEEMLIGMRTCCPGAAIDGVSLQLYVHPPYAIELILGAQSDPAIGPVLMIGLGGVTAEIHRDCSFELPPLDERLATRMLERLRSWRLLAGYRGRRRMATEALVSTLLRFSTLIAENPRIASCDINPLLVTPDAVLALDARISVDPQLAPIRPYGHLAIAPYPEELTREVALKDGSRVVVRPIRPADEPLWHAMLDAASDNSIWQRFRSAVRSRVHTQARRYCFIDYDREMALVAEARVAGRPQLVGVGRLVADSNHQRAEFAVLVVDAWQGRGLGRQLLGALVDYARSAGLRQIYAETAYDNRRMLELFRSAGFQLRPIDHDPSTTAAELSL